MFFMLYMSLFLYIFLRKTDKNHYTNASSIVVLINSSPVNNHVSQIMIDDLSFDVALVHGIIKVLYDTGEGGIYFVMIILYHTQNGEGCVTN